MIPLRKPDEEWDIRFATENDIPEMLPLYDEWADENHVPLPPKAAGNDIREMLQTGRVFLMTINGSIIGFMGAYISTLFWNGEKVAHEHYIFMKKEYRNGCGEMLIKAFEKWAKFMGCKTLIITPNSFGTKRFRAVARRLESVGYHLHGMAMSKDVRDV